MGWDRLPAFVWGGLVTTRAQNARRRRRYKKRGPAVGPGFGGAGREWWPEDIAASSAYPSVETGGGGGTKQHGCTNSSSASVSPDALPFPHTQPPAVPSFAAACQGAFAEPPAVGLAAVAPAPLPEDALTPDAWVPRDARLLRLTGRHPFNCEPPPQDLEACGPITTPGLHFVRNHGPVPRREWGGHTVTVAGVVDVPTELTMDELTAMPARTLTVTMACAGNRRKEQNMHRKSQVRWRVGGWVESVLFFSPPTLTLPPTHSLSNRASTGAPPVSPPPSGRASCCATC